MLVSSEMIEKMSELFTQNVKSDVSKKIQQLSEFYKMDDIYLSLVDQYLFPCLILNDKGEIVASSKNAGQYVKNEKGNIDHILPSGLSFPINTAIQRLRNGKREVVFKNLPVYLGGRLFLINLKLIRFFRQYQKLYVLFIENKQKAEEKRLILSENSVNQTNDAIQTLCRKIKELEVSNQKLTRKNQQLLRSNRELRTINEKFEKKIGELTEIKSDMYSLLDQTNVAALFLDQHLNVKYLTPEATKLFRLKKSEIAGSIHVLTSHLKYDEFVQDLKRVLCERETVHKELESLNGDWYAVEMTPYYTNEVIKGIIVTFFNMTELKLTNEALHISSQVVDQSPTNILIASTSGNVQYVNKRFCEMIGKEEFEIIGENVFTFNEKHRVCSELSVHWQDVVKNKAWSGELHYQDDEGVDMWEQVSLIPVEDHTGTVQQVMRISEDITNQKRSEKMLMKSEMLSAIGQLAAGIAHEIRNPLTSLKGFLQLMIQTKKYQKDYAEVMMSEFIRLESIINEFLVLAKTKSATFDLVQVNTIIEDVCMILESQASLKNVQIKKTLCEKLPEIHAVSNELKQVFLNILKNAFEAMEHTEGVISIESYQENGKVVIIFEDQGKGIPKEVLKKLGEPFYTTKDKGTGLGLMVTFKIIENHGGHIHFQSEEGKGTQVKLELPIKE
ncbi:PAS domain-containing protein [Bacillus sp. WMMC1349]|uniref:ATP-binding protein n=1 Tax=Bacillus sp. WMMC1349 TaxID=2736254 RepID=UPI001556D512|nr:ATP-binding protein [Bacillus sp. WMMC1349]NPC91986.1 PAS domain-containing protein [Bacillus sp. WMMC1349]